MNRVFDLRDMYVVLVCSDIYFEARHTVCIIVNDTPLSEFSNTLR